MSSLCLHFAKFLGSFALPLGTVDSKIFGTKHKLDLDMGNPGVQQPWCAVTAGVNTAPFSGTEAS